MNYISTRDESQKEYSFSEVLLKGLAEDGGLFVPVEYPFYSLEALEKMRTFSYPELAIEVIGKFVGESIPEEDLKGIINRTYTKESFGSEEIAPVKSVFDSIYIQDLSSGPSLAFKDMAMQFLGQCMEYVLGKEGKQLTIVGASSGDTVSAAEEAFRGKAGINVVMLTPKEGMSPFQKAQAGSILDKNIYNISIPGPFDTCQDLVKAINKDAAFKEQYSIGAVNSINWGRITAQVVYYFKGYFSVTESVGMPMDVVVPSGNFGNVLAAYVAKHMGLPLRRLIVATNENKVLDHFFKTGIYKQRDVVVTSCPSMDISKASNIERLFFDILGRDPKKLSALMSTFETRKSCDLSASLQALTSDYGFVSGESSHADRQQVIQDVYNSSELVIDPHTAAAVKVAREFVLPDAVPLLCMETAKPSKFEEAVSEALGFTPERPKAFVGLEEKEQRFYDVSDSPEAIKAFVSEHISL